MAIWKWYWSEISAAVLAFFKFDNWQSDLMPLVILVMHPKMHAIHVFKWPKQLFNECNSILYVMELNYLNK